MASLADCISPALGLSAALTVNPRSDDGDTFCIFPLPPPPPPFFFFFELRVDPPPPVESPPAAADDFLTYTPTHID